MTVRQTRPPRMPNAPCLEPHLSKDLSKGQTSLQRSNPDHLPIFWSDGPDSWDPFLASVPKRLWTTFHRLFWPCALPDATFSASVQTPNRQCAKTPCEFPHCGCSVGSSQPMFLRRAFGLPRLPLDFPNQALTHYYQNSRCYSEAAAKRNPASISACDAGRSSTSFRDPQS